MRVAHCSIDENGKTKGGNPGDQSKKECCVRSFYKKPWVYLLRCRDAGKAEKMSQAAEWLANSNLVGYDQSNRLSLYKELKLLQFDYKKLTKPCEADCSSFVSALAQIAGIDIPYPSGNAPTTSNMVKIFTGTGMFDLITTDVNKEENLKRGDILVGKPASHTVIVLDDGVQSHIQSRRTIKLGMKGSDVIIIQKILVKEGYDIGKYGIDGDYGKDTQKAVLAFQKEHFADPKDWDGIVGVRTWCMLEKYN